MTENEAKVFIQNAMEQSKGDPVILKEWDGEKYTGRETSRNIVYALRDVPEYGLMPGYVIFGW